MTAPTLNGLRVLSVRLIQPWRGAWVADCELDPDTVSLVPTSGPATLLVAGSTLIGTVDPRGAGSFGATAAVRVVAGGGGWDKAVPALHYHADNGVVSSSVYSAAATIVGETVIDESPLTLGTDFMRSAGPASRVFRDADWYVDLTGVTHAGVRPAATLDPSATLIAWDPVQQRAALTCDVLVLPGTGLSDPRLNGATPTIRDVEQTFDADGSKIVAWCAERPAPRLLSALTNAVRELARTATLKVYPYRIALEGSDGRLQLQAVNPTAGMPDTLPVAVWPGMQGDSGQYQLGALVAVHFLEGAAGLPPTPVVVGFSPGGKPVKRAIDATVELDVGPSAAVVALAGGTTPLVLAPWAAGLATALTTFAAAMAAAATGPLAPMAAPAHALQTALGSLPAPATTKTVAA